jgi:hypothetical protein
MTKLIGGRIKREDERSRDRVSLMTKLIGGRIKREDERSRDRVSLKIS